MPLTDHSFLNVKKNIYFGFKHAYFMGCHLSAEFCNLCHLIYITTIIISVFCAHWVHKSVECSFTEIFQWLEDTGIVWFFDILEHNKMYRYFIPVWERMWRYSTALQGTTLAFRPHLQYTHLYFPVRWNSAHTATLYHIMLSHVVSHPSRSGIKFSTVTQPVLPDTVAVTKLSMRCRYYTPIS